MTEWHTKVWFPTSVAEWGAAGAALVVAAWVTAWVTARVSKCVLRNWWLLGIMVRRVRRRWKAPKRVQYPGDEEAPPHMD